MKITFWFKKNRPKIQKKNGNKHGNKCTTLKSNKFKCTSDFIKFDGIEMVVLVYYFCTCTLYAIDRTLIIRLETSSQGKN